MSYLYIKLFVFASRNLNRPCISALSMTAALVFAAYLETICSQYRQFRCLNPHLSVYLLVFTTTTHSLIHSLTHSLTNLSTYSCHKRLSISQCVHKVCTIRWEFLSFLNFLRYQILTTSTCIAKLDLVHTYSCKICHHPPKLLNSYNYRPKLSEVI